MPTGPRWASWNLGIFICIRCAGIHRNLGVHISKVKSVNLDQWTQEQVQVHLCRPGLGRVGVRVGSPLWFVVFQCVQEMGNAKAKRLYEAFLPECFQRPETDQSAEIFIRDKYDKKKYMDKVIDIQMLRVSLRARSVDLQEKCVAQQNGCFDPRRKKRAATTYPRSRLCLRR